MALLALGLLLAILQGCATRLDATVTSFHQPDLSWQGKRFAIVADESQRDSLEFKAYADLVGQALQRNGLVPAGTSRADVDVKLRYKVEELRPLRYSSPVYYGFYGPYWGPAYGFYPYGPYYGYYGWYGPYWGVPMGVAATETREYRNWRHELKLDLGPPGGKPQYEATATAETGSASLANVMPALVEAIFHDFPGPSGQVRQVEIELREPAGPATGAGSGGSPTPSSGGNPGPRSSGGPAPQSSGSQAPSR